MKFGPLTLENNLFLAPLAGITDTLLRVIIKRYGCGLVFSEMINSNGVLRGGVKLLEKLDIHPDEGKVGIQIAGDDPRTMAEAAKLAVGLGAVTVNINMGCPSKKVTKNQAGCALMTNPALVRTIIRAVVNAIDVPLSIKIRLGWDDRQMNYLEIAKIAEDEGCVAVFMHARTRKDAFSGEARLSEIKKLKDHCKIPIIGNGDVTSPEKALAMFEQTDCDGIMIGRGALGQPWIFRQILEAQQGLPPSVPSLQERKELMVEHLDMSVERYGTEIGLRLMQKHFSWYSKGIQHSAKFRETIHQYKKDLKRTKAFIEDFFESIDEAPDPRSSSLKNQTYSAPQSDNHDGSRVHSQC